MLRGLKTKNSDLLALAAAATKPTDNRWRRFRRRPTRLTWAGVGMVIAGSLSLAAAPFLLTIEQIRARTWEASSINPWTMAAALMAFAVIAIGLGSQILRGRAWARSGVVLFGIAALVGAFFLVPFWVVGLLLAAYVALLVLLFHWKCNRYFDES